jgi:hypothetical protein
MMFTQGEQDRQLAPQIALTTTLPIWRAGFYENVSNISILLVHPGVNSANI